ncbi:MAG: hypothetical protein UHW86_03180 [Spirochaetota bacterium]|nr:hypothetical protein [Spirochaetota bacterium]
MVNVYFLPFVGSEYDSGGIFGKKILILGESHHCDPGEATRNFTKDVMEKHLYEESYSTFTKFERSLVGRETNQDERIKIWNSLIFYNYLQEPMSDVRLAGTREQYCAAESALFAVLEKYAPEYMIVWGTSRLWCYIPKARWTGLPAINVDGKDVFHGEYLLDNKHSVKTIGVYHPSSGYSWDYWYKVLTTWWR